MWGFHSNYVVLMRFVKRACGISMRCNYDSIKSLKPIQDVPAPHTHKARRFIQPIADMHTHLPASNTSTHGYLHPYTLHV